MKTLATITLAAALTLGTVSTASAKDYDYNASTRQCPKGSPGGAKAGIIVGSILLPFSLLGIIGVGIGGKRHRAHKRAKAQGVCDYSAQASR